MSDSDDVLLFIIYYLFRMIQNQNQNLKKNLKNLKKKQNQNL